MRGWYETYGCGCVSDTVTLKRMLLGYCAVHGSSRGEAHPDYDEPAPYDRSEEDMREGREERKGDART